MCQRLCVAQGLMAGCWSHDSEVASQTAKCLHRLTDRLSSFVDGVCRMDLVRLGPPLFALAFRSAVCNLREVRCDQTHI